jgi:hypothetical protein
MLLLRFSRNELNAKGTSTSLTTKETLGFRQADDQLVDKIDSN